MNWIDVNEKLPNIKDGQSDTVIGFSENGIPYIGYFMSDIDGNISFLEGNELYEIRITHWAKIEPPKTKYLKCPY